MECVQCGLHIESYPCFYCDARPPRRRRSYTKLVFWAALVMVVAGMAFAVKAGMDAKERAERLYKENFVRQALEFNTPSELARGVQYDYELTGADTVQDNRCARRIAELECEEAAEHLRRHISMQSRLRPLAYELIGLAGDWCDARYLINVFEYHGEEREECTRRTVQIASRHGSLLEGGGEIPRFLNSVLQDRRYQGHALRAIAEFPHYRLSSYVEHVIETTCLHSNADAVLAVLDINYPNTDLVLEVIVHTACGPERGAASDQARTEAAIRWLTQLLGDPASSFLQKENAKRYLSELEMMHGTAACKVQYEAGSLEARIRAVSRAGHLFDDQRTAFLEKALEDPAMGVRLEAIRALGAGYDPGAVQLLVEVLSGKYDQAEDETGDWYEAARCVAAASLGRTGASEAVPALARALWMAQPVRGCVYKALTEITMEDYGANARAYLDWYQQNKDR